MYEQYELINFGKNVPAKLKCLFLKQMDGHWHKGIEILLVLSGEVNVICDGEPYSLKEDDLIVINESTIHSLSSEYGCNLVSLQIDTDKLAPNIDLFFDCNSSKDDNKGRYYNIKRLIAEIVKTNSAKNENNIFYNFSIIYALYYELAKTFATKRTNQNNTQKYFERLNRIINYIDKHYRENITLSSLAEVEHLSVPYLSSFIEKYLGVNFQTYYNEVRLNRAVNDLLTTDHSVEEISYAHGFSDPRSFVNVFKKKYNTIPSTYRKQLQNIPTEQDPFMIASSLLAQGRFENKDSNLEILAKYLPDPTQNASKENIYIDDVKVINKKNINTALEQKTLNHNFKVFTSVARAKELLYEGVQKQLTEIQNEIGYEYIKFHGLLSDDMLVYREDALGKPHYSFIFIDKVIDFLLSINLKPLIQFSFMPKDLAKNPDHPVYCSPFYISPPKDINKWKDLIRALTQHFVERYGMKTVESWLFCVWNEPDTSTTLFGFENDNDFYELYKATFDVTKDINKNFLFGSPSLLVTYNINRQWIIKFINWCSENGCTPDFMNIHFYDNDFSDSSLQQHRPAMPAHGKLNMDENSFHNCINSTKELFVELGIGDLPIYLTEWNLTVSHRNLLNDTCFKSCYLAKNLLENYDELNSFGYWVLSDFMEELQPSTEQFHGGLGLFTIDGIKKTHYYTFDFINRLGDKLIDRGDGYFITKSYNSIQIILYNYEHFNHLFAAGETFDMTFTKRYTPFSQLGKMSATLELMNIPATECLIKENIVNQHYGSAFDEWVYMGAPEMDKSIIEYLKRICVPKLIVHKEKIDNSSLIIQAKLEPLEVRLIEIEYIK